MAADREAGPDAALGLSAILASAAGALLYRRAPGPDEAHGVALILGAFFHFLAYAVSQIAWGRLLLRGKGKFWEAALWGSVLFALLPAVLGFFPVVGAGAFPAWLTFLLAGPVALLWIARREFSWRVCFPGVAQMLGLLAVLWLLMGAAYPHSFWDSLWYHLTASRFWFDAGRVHLPPTFPVAFQAGLWDYHFLWGQILLGGPGAGGLIPAQLFGQWAAVASSAFCLLLLLEESESLGITAWAALAGWLGTELFAEAEFAKNDWAAAFWALSALVLFLRQRQQPAAIVAGFAFAAKFTAGFFLLPLFLAEGRRNVSSLLKLAGFGLLAATPILLRNLILTGNPFFPALSAFFPTDLLGPSWRAISRYESGTFTLGALAIKLGFVVRDSSVVLGLLALPLSWRRFPALARTPLFVAAAGSAGFLVLSGEKAEWRLVGACLLLLAVYGAEGVLIFLRSLPLHVRRGSYLVVAALLLWRVPVDWKAPSRFGREPAEAIREHVSGAAMAWVRMNAVGASAATLQEQRIYYLFPLLPRRAFDEAALDQALSAAQNSKDAVIALRTAGIRYLVLSGEFLDRLYDRRICDWMFELSERNPGAVVFRTPLSRVLDLDQVTGS